MRSIAIKSVLPHANRVQNNKKSELYIIIIEKSEPVAQN